VPPPAAASKKSWRVELTTDDSKRLVNGVRLETKAEAALYAAMGICDLLRPLWELDHEPPIVVMTRVLASADTVNCDVRYPKKNRRAQLRFSHGECHLHVWHPEDETGPSCPAAAAPTDDGLDIPGCLRRRP
jgi:hypothetical protein